MATVTDSATGITTTYYYDFTDRLMKYVESGTNYSHSVGYEYDNINNLTKLVETINGVAHTSTYTYDDDNRIVSKTTDGIGSTYTYDAYGRISGQTVSNNGSNVMTKALTYRNPTSALTSGQVATYSTTIGGSTYAYSYTYDDNGNILTVSDGTYTTTYTYDTANQLKQEVNEKAKKTWNWTYDNAGNITSRAETNHNTNETTTVAYTYGDSAWGDLLTAYNGNTITYDEVGNMLSDGTWTYTWEHGRQLASMTDGTNTWTFTYDANGMRTGRTNASTTYSYVYNGDQLSQLTVLYDGETYVFVFNYDASGIPVSFTLNGSQYYYVTNQQGDVVSVVNSSGERVCGYYYTAWNISSLALGSDPNAGPILVFSPFTYRGYVMDFETGLFYLQSRYYNAAMGRFISADVYVATGQGMLGNNMFAYCANNPVMYTDPKGTFLVCEKRNMLAVDGGGSGSFGGGAGAAMLFSFVWLADIIGALTGTASLPHQQEKEEEKVESVAATKSVNNSAVYYPADILGSKTSPKVWKTYPMPMDYDTAIAWVIATAASGQYGKNASWGLYTPDQADALEMATALGGALPCLHTEIIGIRPHYHVAGMDLFGQYKHFHIWYGEEYRG